MAIGNQEHTSLNGKTHPTIGFLEGVKKWPPLDEKTSLMDSDPQSSGLVNYTEGKSLPMDELFVDDASEKNFREIESALQFVNERFNGVSPHYITRSNNQSFNRRQIANTWDLKSLVTLLTENDKSQIRVTKVRNEMLNGAVANRKTIIRFSPVNNPQNAVDLVSTRRSENSKTFEDAATIHLPEDPLFRTYDKVHRSEAERQRILAKWREEHGFNDADADETQNEVIEDGGQEVNESEFTIDVDTQLLRQYLTTLLNRDSEDYDNAVDDLQDSLPTKGRVQFSWYFDEAKDEVNFRFGKYTYIVSVDTAEHTFIAPDELPLFLYGVMWAVSQNRINLERLINEGDVYLSQLLEESQGEGALEGGEEETQPYAEDDEEDTEFDDRTDEIPTVVSEIEPELDTTETPVVNERREYESKVREVKVASAELQILLALHDSDVADELSKLRIDAHNPDAIDEILPEGEIEFSYSKEFDDDSSDDEGVWTLTFKGKTYEADDNSIPDWIDTVLEMIAKASEDSDEETDLDYLDRLFEVQSHPEAQVETMSESELPMDQMFQNGALMTDTAGNAIYVFSGSDARFSGELEKLKVAGTKNRRQRSSNTVELTTVKLGESSIYRLAGNGLQIQIEPLSQAEIDKRIELAREDVADFAENALRALVDQNFPLSETASVDDKMKRLQAIVDFSKDIDKKVKNDAASLPLYWGLPESADEQTIKLDDFDIPLARVLDSVVKKQFKDIIQEEIEDLEEDVVFADFSDDEINAVAPVASRRGLRRKVDPEEQAENQKLAQETVQQLITDLQGLDDMEECNQILRYLINPDSPEVTRQEIIAKKREQIEAEDKYSFFSRMDKSKVEQKLREWVRQTFPDPKSEILPRTDEVRELGSEAQIDLIVAGRKFRDRSTLSPIEQKAANLLYDKMKKLDGLSTEIAAAAS